LQFGVLTGHPLPKVLSVEFGCQSGLAIAIYPRGDLPWIFGILQCVEARDWMLNEEKLMLEIGKRLGSELSILLAYRDVKEREMEFRTLAETLPDNITRFDREARIIYANPTLSRTLGKSAAEMRGKTPKQLYPEGSCDAYQDNIELVIRAGRAVEMEMPFPNLRGGIDYFQVAIWRGVRASFGLWRKILQILLSAIIVNASVFMSIRPIASYSGLPRRWYWALRHWRAGILVCRTRSSIWKPCSALSKPKPRKLSKWNAWTTRAIRVILPCIWCRSWMTGRR
jgi:PAS domain S-box-containing protein